MFSMWKKLFLWTFAILLPVVALAPRLVFATPYGQGSYGTCTYQDCSSGTAISVNLSNGQTIPRDGYTIVVAPLSGQTAFQQVDFYIDGTLVQGGVQPASDGTASWRWDPVANPGSKVKIVATYADNSTVSKEFDVTISSSGATTGGTTSGGSSTAGGGLKHIPVISSTIQVIQQVSTQVSNGAKKAIRALPRPVVYSFPYILFVLLGINVVVLMLQAKRELSEYRTLQTVLARMRAMEEGKKSFLSLVSHYLRTPLTVVAGGVEMLQGSGMVVSPVVDLKSVSDRLREKIELLIDQVRSSASAPAAVVSGDVPARVRLWRQPGLLLPIGLIGMVAFGFTYLTTRAGSFTISQVNVATQVIVFSILVLTMYQVVRRIQLHKRDAVVLRQVVQQEEAELQSRDKLITATASALNDDIQSLDKAVAVMEGVPAAKFIQRGQSQFRDLMAKFSLVSGLRGGHSNKPFVTVRMSDMLDQAQRRLGPAMSSRGITLAAKNAGQSFPTQDPLLLTFVVQSLLDNAVAFSPNNAAVEVDVQVLPSGITLTVTDRGAGIPPEKQSLLFKPFSRADDTETFNHEGIGLSLYIDKLIMTYLGGAIELESEPGLTTGVLHLPAAA